MRIERGASFLPPPSPQVISDGFIGFGQASKISDTPFPFPYQSLGPKLPARHTPSSIAASCSRGRFDSRFSWRLGIVWVGYVWGPQLWGSSCCRSEG